MSARVVRLEAGGLAGLGRLLATHRFAPYWYHAELAPERRLAHLLATLEAALSTDGCRAHVVERDGEPCGLVLSGPRRWESEALGLRAGFLGPLILDGADAAPRGAALVERALAELAADGIRHVTTRVDGEELGHLHLYESLGFVTLDTVMHLERLPREDAAGLGRGCRLHRAEDVPGLERIAARAYRHDRLHADPVVPPEKADAAYAAWIRSSCHGLDDAVLVAVDGESPVGFMTVRRDRAAREDLGLDVAKVWLVGVAEKARGRGVGRALLAAVLDWSARRGADVVEVGTQIRNMEALRFYLRNGFVPVNTVVALRRLLGA